MAFPEGQRSPDGRLIDFKGGIFSMAVKTKVPIVPISLSNTHAVMPGNSLFPVQPGAGKLHIHVHESIDTDGLSEVEIAARVRDTLLSKMPVCQHPLPVKEDATEEEIAADAGASTPAEAATVSIIGESSAVTHHSAPSALAHVGAEITDAIMRKEEDTKKGEKAEVAAKAEVEA